MSNDIDQLVSETIELTGASPPDLLADDSPALVARDNDADAPAELYLVGVIGGKDVGKSSLINAIVGQEITARTSHGPGTEHVIGYAHRAAMPELRALLDQEVPGRYEIRAHDVESLRGQVLLDLPDVDSVYADHIETTRRMLRHMLFPLWVQSIEKYADQQPQRLLARVAEGNDPANFVFCLNKADQLDAREGATAVGQVRDDYARRVARLLKLEREPQVFMISALHPDRYDLPPLRKLLGRQKSNEVVRQSRQLAGQQRVRTVVQWLDAQQLPEAAARAGRLLEEAQELTAARIGGPLLERAIPRLMDDPGYRLAMVEPALAARMARWPVVNVVNSLFSPITAVVRRNLYASVPLAGNEIGNIDVYLDRDGRSLPSLIQTTFAQLQQTSPTVSELFRDEKLWEAPAAEGAAGDLRRRLDDAVQRQRAELMHRIAGRRGIVAPVFRWLLTIGALLWFPIVQPLLEIVAAAGWDWRSVVPRLASLAIQLLGATYLLHSIGFLVLYFLVLWAVLRWNTHRRAARIIQRWRSIDASDVRSAAVSLPFQVIDWLDDLLDPIRRHRDRVEQLVRRVEALRTGLTDQRRAA